MMNYMNQNSGAILVILATLALLGAGIGWITNEINGVRGEINVVRSEVNDLRGEIRGLRQDQVAMERRLS